MKKDFVLIDVFIFITIFAMLAAMFIGVRYDKTRIITKNSSNNRRQTCAEDNDWVYIVNKLNDNRTSEIILEGHRFLAVYLKTGAYGYACIGVVHAPECPVCKQNKGE